MRKTPFITSHRIEPSGLVVPVQPESDVCMIEELPASKLCSCNGPQWLEYGLQPASQSIAATPACGLCEPPFVAGKMGRMRTWQAKTDTRQPQSWPGEPVLSHDKVPLKFRCSFLHMEEMEGSILFEGNEYYLVRY